MEPKLILIQFLAKMNFDQLLSGTDSVLTKINSDPILTKKKFNQFSIAIDFNPVLKGINIH